jgi:hypothetical protein
MAFEKITVSTVVKSLSAAKYGTRLVTGALITCETAAVRIMTDGSTPDATTGLLMAAGATLTIDRKSSLVGFRAIRATGSDGVLQVAYFQ